MVWLVWLRVAPLPGCRVTPGDGEPALECALACSGVEEPRPLELREALDAALRSHRHRVAAVEACVAFDPRDWHAGNDPDGRVRGAAATASDRAGAHFASFGCRPPVSSA